MKSAPKNIRLDNEAGCSPEGAISSSFEASFLQPPFERSAQTGLLLPGPFLRRLAEEVERAVRLKESVALIVLEPAAQEAYQPENEQLALCAQVMVSSARGGESLGHIGEMQLALVLPGATAMKARAACSRLERAFESLSAGSIQPRFGVAALDTIQTETEGQGDLLGIKLAVAACQCCSSLDDTSLRKDENSLRKEHFFVEACEKQFLFFGTVE